MTEMILPSMPLSWFIVCDSVALIAVVRLVIEQEKFTFPTRFCLTVWKVPLEKLMSERATTTRNGCSE